MAFKGSDALSVRWTLQYVRVSCICAKMRIKFGLSCVEFPLQKDVIYIEPVPGIDPFNFDLTDDDKEKLYDAGYAVAKSFIAAYEWS